MAIDYNLELISFKLCPYVQRSVITLLKKGEENFKIKFIDLSDKPGWFLEISPMGKVPILKVNNEILFESSVINEFIDDITNPHFSSKEPLQRAKEKAWIEFESELNSIFMKLITTKNREDMVKQKQELFDKLKKIEEIIEENSRYFRGEEFSLVDTAYAPLFMRMFLIHELRKDTGWNDIPKIRYWAENLIEEDAVKKSVVDSFEEDFKKFLKNKGSIFA